MKFTNINTYQQAIFDTAMQMPCQTKEQREIVAKLINISIAEVDLQGKEKAQNV